MNTRIRIATIAAFLIVSLALAACNAAHTTSSATPKAPLSANYGQANTQSNLSACKIGAQDEPIMQFGFKMTSATSGWGLAQCTVAARPAFAGGSTIQCIWPQVEAVGILHTTDGGVTWTDVSPPSVSNRTWHHAQFFLDSTHAWVAEVSRTADACVSQITTYRTSDGGQTWEQGGAVAVKTALPTDDVFNVGYHNYMEFLDAQHGWLLVASPPNPSGGPGNLVEPVTMYATADGGLNWRLVANNPGSSALSAGATCQPNSYFLGGDPAFTSATTGWLLVSCPAQTLLMTQDGGTTWRPEQLPSCTCPVSQPTFFDSTHGIITGQSSSVMLATSDGGASWTQFQVPAGALQQFSFIDANNGWLVSVEQLPTSYDTAVHRTTDGGRSWSLLGKPGFATSTSNAKTYYPIVAVQFVDANVGFVALGPLAGSPTVDPTAPQFQLLGTQNGGRTWTVVFKQVPSRPCSVQYHQLGQNGVVVSPVKMASATTAWAQGGLRTTDGGAHWRDVSSTALREGASSPLYPPGYTEFFLDGDHAWQAGTYGSATACSDHITTFATSDGGKTWQPSAPVPLDLPSGYITGGIDFGFTSPQAGWLWVLFGTQSNPMEMNITGGHLFTTSDGGLTWRNIATIDASKIEGLAAPTSNCQSTLGQVTFSSATTGWMTLSCVFSKILATHDGGATWKVQSLPVSCQCSMQLPTFVDEKHGFLQFYDDNAPGGPTVMSTSDGGATWLVRPPLPNSGSTMALTIVDANNLWALVTPPGWTKFSGGKDSLYRSTDGGQTWSLVQEGVPILRADAFLFADATNGMVSEPRNSTWSFDTPGYADAGDEELAVTSDGGHTWKFIKPAIGT